MTRDEIINMARRAGFDQSNPHEDVIARHSNGSWVGITERLALFAQEVAAAEREACAKTAEGIGQRRDWVPKSLMGNLRRELAAAIRARGPKSCARRC